MNNTARCSAKTALAWLLLCFVLTSGASLAASLQGTQGKSKSAPTTQSKAKDDSHMDPGEHAFQTNCSRCHNAPDQLAPHISGTVVRHMRVRANLSAKDEALILHFLAP